MTIKLKPRPVHYRAAGGLQRFSCYRVELTDYLGSAYTMPSKWNPSWTVTAHTKPFPSTTTNLHKVTCRNCWLQIQALANSRLK